MDSVNASGADDNNTKIDTAADIITATSSDTASETETNKAPHLRIDTNIAYIDIDSENATTDVDEVSIVSSKISDRLTSDNILTEKAQRQNAMMMMKSMNPLLVLRIIKMI